MRFGGLDFSLTSMGVAVLDDGKREAWAVAPKQRSYPRLRFLADTAVRVFDGCDAIAVEGPAFGAKGNAGHGLAGGWWVVTLALWEAGHKLVVITPPVVKKYATGNGHADKFAVFGAALRRLPSVEVHGPDAADALWLAHAVADHYGHPVTVMPKAQRDALYSKSTTGRRKGLPVVEWPDRPAIITEASSPLSLFDGAGS